ncbi:efflux RND transporter periplasmic adaptor subunit [Nemorincola caseinilytica]|uniref:Efflux RND transporter periplasmic adaptor subunit n=1 Tax=Nemorincola caseinilytica TaxID=2054315 RepID=A0ABP8NM47_9BACT
MRSLNSATVFFSVCISGILSLASCSEKKQDVAAAKQQGPKVLNADGMVIKAEAFQTDYTTSGTLLPNEEVNVMPEIPGRITAISFAEGAPVQQGQVLARLYNDDIKAQIQKLKAQRELQVKIRDRQAELLNVGGISKQDYETTTTQIEAIDADIAYATSQLRKTSIIAPFSGRAGIRNVSNGAVVGTGTVLTTLQQTATLKMDFNIPEQYRYEMVIGKKIAFTVTGRQDTFVAVIKAVEPSANAATRTLRVRATVDNKNNKLGPGAFTHIVIPFGANAHALLVPSQSVIPTNREKVVAVIRGGKAEMVPVKIGARTNERVEILQGLNEGDTILTTGIMQVKPGMEVKVKVI